MTDENDFCLLQLVGDGGRCNAMLSGGDGDQLTDIFSQTLELEIVIGMFVVARYKIPGHCKRGAGHCKRGAVHHLCGGTSQVLFRCCPYTEKYPRQFLQPVGT